MYWDPQTGQPSPQGDPPAADEADASRFIPTMSRRTLGIILAVVAVALFAVFSWCISSQRADVHTTVAALADDLTAHGFTCELEEVNVLLDGDGIAGGETGRCVVDGDQTFLTVYPRWNGTQEQAEAGLDDLAGSDRLTLALGPNWTILSLDETATEAIADALGARMIEVGGVSG